MSEDAMREALEAAALQFEFYEQQHMAKQPPDRAKARTNRRYAEICRAAVSSAAPTSGEREKALEIAAIVETYTDILSPETARKVASRIRSGMSERGP